MKVRQQFNIKNQYSIIRKILRCQNYQYFAYRTIRISIVLWAIWNQVFTKNNWIHWRIILSVIIIISQSIPITGCFASLTHALYLKHPTKSTGKSVIWKALKNAYLAMLAKHSLGCLINTCAVVWWKNLLQNKTNSRIRKCTNLGILNKCCSLECKGSCQIT